MPELRERRDHISALATSGESETLEFKATMTVCAFPNQRGGQVLFGVTEAWLGSRSASAPLRS